MELPNNFFNHDAQAGGFFPKSHVGLDISGFGQKQNILIEGIRGTGKTHILKMVERYCLENFESLRVLPIYVSLAQINEHARKEPDEFRMYLYAHIVRRCIETIEKHKSALQESTPLFRKAFDMLLRLFRMRELTKFEEVLEAIKSVADELLYQLQFDMTNLSFKNGNEENTSIQGSVSTKTKASIPGIEAEVAGSFAPTEGHKSNFEETVTFLGSRLIHQDASQFIISFLQQLQVILNLEHTLILLDECSEASAKAQVEVFRFFKAIRGAQSLLPEKDSSAFFIGTVYPQGETYYPNREMDGFTFQSGQDCTMEFLQWDETDLDTYVRFFSDMTWSRAKNVLNYQGNSTSLRNEIFDRNDAFLLAAYCAHGIPRRYWEILKRAYDRSSNRILYTGVTTAVQEIANTQILALGSLVEQDLQMLNHIANVVSGENKQKRIKNNEPKRKQNPLAQTIYFSVDRASTDSLRRLVMQGAIHDKARMRITNRRGRLTPKPMYSIDMAVAYTLSAILPGKFVQVIAHDIPRSPDNDFAGSPGITYAEVQDTYGNPEYIAVQPDDADLKNASGKIKSYEIGKHGYVVFDDDDKLTAFFWGNTIEEEKRLSLKSGDSVDFRYGTNKRGLQAFDIRLKSSGAEKSQTWNAGIVKFFNHGKSYGYILDPDGGPDIFYEAKSVVSSRPLRSGDNVVFQFSTTNRRGRVAEKVKLNK